LTQLHKLCFDLEGKLSTDACCVCKTGGTGYIIEARSLEGEMTRSDQVSAGSLATIRHLLPGVWYSLVVKSLNVFGKINPQGSEELYEQSGTYALYLYQL